MDVKVNGGGLIWLAVVGVGGTEWGSFLKGVIYIKVKVNVSNDLGWPNG